MFEVYFWKALLAHVHTYIHISICGPDISYALPEHPALSLTITRILRPFLGRHTNAAKASECGRQQT